MSFFEELPPPARLDDDRPEPTLPEWFGPPKDVMGGVVARNEAVVRSEHVFIGLQTVSAWPTGLLLHLVFGARRGGLAPERWESVRASLFPDVRRRGAPSGDGALRLGVELGDGRRLSAVGRLTHNPFTGQPSPPLLMEHGGGSSSGSRTMDGRTDLWLWPLPDGEALSLVLHWPELDVPLVFHRIDLGQVRTAAGRAMPYWPHTRDQEGTV